MDGLEFWSVLDLTAYWRDQPPVHELVAPYLGVKLKPAAKPLPTGTDDPSGIGGLLAQCPSGFVPANR